MTAVALPFLTRNDNEMIPDNKTCPCLQILHSHAEVDRVTFVIRGGSEGVGDCVLSVLGTSAPSRYVRDSRVHYTHPVKLLPRFASQYRRSSRLAPLSKSKYLTRKATYPLELACKILKSLHYKYPPPSPTTNPTTNP